MDFKACGGVLDSPFESSQVKRKDPLDLEEGDMKRPRPSTPPDEDDEGWLSRRRSTPQRRSLFNVLNC